MGTPRLRRALGATSSLFRLRSTHNGVVADDDTLGSVTITRGSAPVGLSVSTATVTMRQQFTPLGIPHERLMLELTDHGVDRVATLADAGTVFPEELRARYTGRAAGRTVTDHGPRSPLVTELQLTDRLSSLRTIDAGARADYENHNHDGGIDLLVQSLLARAGISYESANFLSQFYPDPVYLGNSWHATLVPPGFTIWPTAETLDLFVAECGHLLRSTRAGVPQLLSHAYRHQLGRARALVGDVANPLTRAQVLSPVAWTEHPAQPRGITATVSHHEAGTITIVANAPGYSVATNADLDLTKIVGEYSNLWPQDGPVGAIRAKVTRESPTGPNLERVTVDVLALLTSPTASHRAQAAQLLILEHGDPVTLVHDWPTGLAGVYYVQTVTETITPHDWRLELSLVPYAGIAGEPLPGGIPSGPGWSTHYPPGTTWAGTAPDTWSDTE